MPGRWQNRPEGSNWGDFGLDDQIGRLNLLTPERVLRAVAEVRAGRVFCLSLPLTLPGGARLNPNRRPPRLLSAERGNRGVPNYLYSLEREKADATDVICDDAVLLFTQYSTQWDALAHVGSTFDADGDGMAELVFYNGWRGHQDIREPSESGEVDSNRMFGGAEASALGIERMAETGVQGRGVLLDLQRHLGSSGGAVGYDLLAEVMEKDGIEVEAGDILCLHTGFGRLLLEMNGDPDPERLHRECAALDGRDPALLDWITASGVAAIVADNYAVETYPARPCEGRCAALPLHEHCLFKLGIPLGELWYLTELADWLRAHDRHRFLLTAPPLRLPGAVGSPVTPVATV